MDTLDHLERQILSKLELLAEGSSSDYGRPNLHRAHPQSSAPPGAFEGDLSPMLSLKAYHERRLVQAREKGQSARLVAIAEAEKDYETAKHRPPSYISADSEQNERDRDEAILRWEGRRPEQVAVFESCSASYVRKIRKRCNRDQTWGGMLDESPVEISA